MTTLWEHEEGGTHYSVRQSGASIRLYSNKVFHTQWNPNKPIAGGVWDCLSLPVLYRPVNSSPRILLLGVGGGAVVRQLELLTDFSEMIAVEIDSRHLDIATRWFGVTDPRVSLVHADAIQWLANYDGPPFDLIIDDLFGHDQGEPMRACELTFSWTDLLRTHLVSTGLLVVNCVNSKELKQASLALVDAGFRYGYRWSLPVYENAIGVLSNAPVHARDWSRHLEEVGLDASAQRQARAIMRRPLKGL